MDSRMLNFFRFFCIRHNRFCLELRFFQCYLQVISLHLWPEKFVKWSLFHMVQIRSRSYFILFGHGEPKVIVPFLILAAGNNRIMKECIVVNFSYQQKRMLGEFPWGLNKNSLSAIALKYGARILHGTCDTIVVAMQQEIYEVGFSTNRTTFTLVLIEIWVRSSPGRPSNDATCVYICLYVRCKQIGRSPANTNNRYLSHILFSIYIFIYKFCCIVHSFKLRVSIWQTARTKSTISYI